MVKTLFGFKTKRFFKKALPLDAKGVFTKLTIERHSFRKTELFFRNTFNLFEE